MDMYYKDFYTTLLIITAYRGALHVNEASFTNKYSLPLDFFIIHCIRFFKPAKRFFFSHIDIIKRTVHRDYKMSNVGCFGCIPDICHNSQDNAEPIYKPYIVGK